MFPKGHFDCVYAYEPRNELKLLSVDAHPELSSEVGTVAWTIGDFLLLKPLAPLHTEQESFTLQDEIVSAQGKSLAGVVLSTNGSVMPPLDAAGRLTLKLLRGITHAVARADQYASFQPDSSERDQTMRIELRHNAGVNVHASEIVLSPAPMDFLTIRAGADVSLS